METSTFAFVSDFLDEGVETVLDNVRERAGLDAVTVAAVYHESRDVFPKGRSGKVRFLEGGAAYFRPDSARYRGLALQPRPSDFVRDEDVFGLLVGEAGRRGLAVHAWVVFLHADWVSDPRPDQSERNAFGDPMLTELCPANPDVRAYVRALSGDIARLGVASLTAESLHYHPLEHGFHHERYFVPLGPLARFLLGLCFCEHCLAAARATGCDAAAARRYARSEIQRALDGGTPDSSELEREEVRALVGSELGAFLDARALTVTSLAREASEAAAAEGARFSFMDGSGAVKGYATGRPEGAPAAEIAWRLGVDVQAVAAAAGGIEAIAYAADPERVRLDLTAYRDLAADARVAAAMRPMQPDCDSAENLAAKLTIARDLGVERVDLYHYGFLPPLALDRIHAAIAAV